MHLGNEPPRPSSDGSVDMGAHAGRTQGVRIALVALIAPLVGGVAVGEWMGWPFLSRPL
jgi:hypothetical protein